MLTIKKLATEMKEFAEESCDDPPWEKTFKKLTDTEVNIVAYCALLSLSEFPLSDIFKWYEKANIDWPRRKYAKPT